MTCLLPLRRLLPGLGEPGAPPSRCQPGRHGSQSRLHLQTSSGHAFKSKPGMCYLNTPPIWCIWIWSDLLPVHALSKCCFAYFYNRAKRNFCAKNWAILYNQVKNESFKNTFLKIQQDLELLQHWTWTAQWLVGSYLLSRPPSRSSGRGSRKALQMVLSSLVERRPALETRGEADTQVSNVKD